MARKKTTENFEMFRRMLKSKIHRATVTDANLHYEGSVTIDSNLLKKVDLLPYEEIAIYNITNGERFQTYVIPGKAGSGVVCINGAAAHKAKKGDLVIMAAYCYLPDPMAKAHQPKVILVDRQNRPVSARLPKANRKILMTASA